MTFTNKAAREMRERVESLVGGRSRGGFVGTFHRWALQLLRRHPNAAGLPRPFAIVDADDQRALINGRAQGRRARRPRTPRRAPVLARISATTNAGLGTGEPARPRLSPLDRGGR